MNKRYRIGSAIVLAALAASTVEGAGLTTFQKAAIEASGIVEAEVVDRLASQDRVRVLFTFDVVYPLTGKRLRSFGTPDTRLALERTADAILQALPVERFELRHRYGAVNAMAGIIDADGLLALLLAPGISGVGFDLPGTAHLGESVPLIHAPEVWDLGFDGSGVTIAVIDTGVDYKHKALKDALKMERKNSQCICQTDGGCCPNGRDRQSGKNAARDDHGHGTHVSGIAAARRKDGVDGGVAFGAYVLPIKTISASNGFCCYSDILAALDWIETDAPQVDVINMSLGTNARYKGNCDNKTASGAATAAVVDALRDRGTLVISSSGNDNDKKKMSIPACVKEVVSVGAVYKANFGRVDWGICQDATSGANKPVCFANTNKKTDLFAPGAPIRSARAGGGAVDFSGTSMASPHVAGCAALLVEATGASAKQIENALASGTKIKDPGNNKKISKLDCKGALDELD